MKWQPISSAPVEVDVLVRSEGGYSVARYDPDLGRWYAVVDGDLVYDSSYDPEIVIVEPIEWMEIPKVSGETMAGPPKLNDDWYSGGMELVSQEIYTALRRLGYEPTGRSFAKTDADLRKQSAQWRLRQFDEVPKDMEEVEWALMEALVIQGSCQVWRGDGLCCAAQMVWAQHERAKIAGAEVDRLRTLSQNNAHSWDAIVRERDELRAALKPFAEAADGYELRPGHTNSAHDSWIYDQRRIIVGDLRRAKEALGG